MTGDTSLLDAMRNLHAALMAAASGSPDPRLERIFAAVPREAFLPRGPWDIVTQQRGYLQTPSDNPVLLYQNILVALDKEQGIHTGEPYLHAGWIGEVAPQPGERVTHIGAGAGYYTAILSMLVLPGGMVAAYEINAKLAAAATRNLIPFENVTLRNENAVEAELPPSDVIYVNAGVAAPPPSWLAALNPGGRLIFPWRPSARVGLAMLVARTAQGFAARPLMPCYFIPCIGVAPAQSAKLIPDLDAARQTKSIWLTRHRAPDVTATAIYDDVWFSSASLA